MLAMRKLFWPTENISVNALGRLGRVAHWSLVAYAILTLLLALAIFFHPSDLPPPIGLPGGSYWLLHSLGALFIGRAIRYILSAE